MASTSRRSLVSRAGAAARKAVTRASAAKSAEKAAPKKTTPKTAAKSVAKSGPSTARKATKKAAQKSAGKTTAKTAVKKNTPATVKKSAAAGPTARKAPASKKAASAVTPKTASQANGAAPAAAAKKAPVKKAPAKKAPAKKAPAKKAPAAAAGRPAGDLVVLEAEDPWTAEELAEVRDQLQGDIARLTGELHDVEADLAGLIRSSGEGAGNDQADVGSATFERDQEMTIVNNARDMLTQSQHALERIENGTYGVCENCGNPIGKNRLMVFPRATLCMSCKQREERR
jgi:RNA polymerase-binding protein DksA